MGGLEGGRVRRWEGLEGGRAWEVGGTWEVMNARLEVGALQADGWIKVLHRGKAHCAFLTAVHLATNSAAHSASNSATNSATNSAANSGANLVAKSKATPRTFVVNLRQFFR